MYNSKNRLSAQVIIIDEVSMVDVVLMYHLLEALDNKTKIIFLGDKDQLPSVEAGQVLSDLVPSGIKTTLSRGMVSRMQDIYKAVVTNVINIVESESALSDYAVILTHSFRNVKSIGKVADMVNRMDSEAINHIPVKTLEEFDMMIKGNEYNGCYGIGTEGRGISCLYNDIITKWIDNYFFDITNSKSYFDLISALSTDKFDFSDSDSALLEQLFSILENNKILTVLKNGLLGSNRINEYIFSIITKRLNIGKNEGYFEGTPIMICQNDYVKKLFNGDIGIIFRDSNNISKAIFYDGEKFVSYFVETLPRFEIAFALTVHKSQGSEYENILLVIPEDSNNKMLHKEILYTGITRAKTLSFIYGTEDILNKMITTPINRLSLMNNFLSGRGSPAKKSNKNL